MLIELYTRYLYIDTYTPEKMDVRKRNFLSSIGTIGSGVCILFFGGWRGKKLWFGRECLLDLFVEKLMMKHTVDGRHPAPRGKYKAL